jgi:hypothetical protein
MANFFLSACLQVNTTLTEFHISYQAPGIGVTGAAALVAALQVQVLPILRAYGWWCGGVAIGLGGCDFFFSSSWDF